MLYKESAINFYNIINKYNFDTPIIIYDTSQFNFTLNSLNNIFSKYKSLKLSYALKANYNEFFIDNLSAAGFGCDVASIYEYNIIKNKNFKFITTTSPYYSKDDMIAFYNDDIIIDFNSIEQLSQFVKLNISNKIGLRVHMSFPQWANDAKGSYGDGSRFGLEINTELMSIIDQNSLIVKRLHTHTGQMDKNILIYKVKYLLSLAKLFPHLEAIDLGGGLFPLLKNRDNLDTLLFEIQNMVDNYNNENNSNIHLIFEPGGAITIPFGYLITSVISKQIINNVEVLTVDSSSWNLLPWCTFEIKNLNRNISNNEYEYAIVGNSLFEGDYFGYKGLNPKKHALSKVEVGDLLIVYSVGGYTTTNSRNFNGLKMPKEVFLNIE